MLKRKATVYIKNWIDTKDFREVDKAQRSLLQGYQYDMRWCSATC